MKEQLDKLQKDVEATRLTIGGIIHLLEKMGTAMEDGFNKVNERLARLEGKDGMQGVNHQLGAIKEELQKIQKVYPYEELLDNMKGLQGEA